MNDKYELLKKEILDLKREVEKAIDADHDFNIMGNGCNPSEVLDTFRYLDGFINKLDKKK